MIYDRTYKAKLWVLLDISDKKKHAKTMEYFLKRGAISQKWPSLYYKDHVLKYKDNGYSMIQTDKEYTIPTSLLLRSAVDTVKDIINSQSRLEQNNKIDYISATIKNDNDYIGVMNYILACTTPRYLSQCFQMYERCHYNKDSVGVIITPEAGEKEILTQISDRVIVISDKPECNCDINISTTPCKYLRESYKRVLA